MRDCEAYMEQISALLDGELGEYEEDVLMAHLDTCPECRLYYDAFFSVSENIGSLALKAPEGFSGDVMNYIDGALQNQALRKRRRMLSRFSALAACLALALMTVTYFRSNGLFFANGGGADKVAAYESVLIATTDSGAIEADAPPMATSAQTIAPAPMSTSTLELPQHDEGNAIEAGEGIYDGMAEDADFDIRDDAENQHVMIMGDIRSIDASEAKEFTDSLADIKTAVFYMGSDSETPAFTIDDHDTVKLLSNLLGWAEKPGDFDVTREPVMLIQALPLAGEAYGIMLWVYEGKLYCGVNDAAGGETMRLYVAGASLDDLLGFMLSDTAA